jgi:PIN domain nuclease of toxin-antitoxin system
VILLDTHVWVWWEVEGDRLPPAFVPTIMRAVGERSLAISAFSCWELAMLVQKGRVQLTLPVSEFLRISVEDSNLRVVDVDARIAIDANALPGAMHGDPADRMIVATARSLGATLLTVDQKLLDYDYVETLRP